MHKRKIELAKEIIQLEEVTLLIQFGSSVNNKKGNDYDFLVVKKLKDGQERIQKKFQVGRIDTIWESKEDFEYYCKVRDPIYATEPLLNGKLLLGSEQYFKEMKEGVKSSRIESSEPEYYLLRESSDEHWKANLFLKNEEIEKSLKSINYSISYRLFAQWYRNNNEVVSWKELRKKASKELKSLIEKVEDLREQFKKEQYNKVSQKQNHQLLKQWDAILLEGSFDLTNNS